MPLDLLGSIVLFFLPTFGLAWPLASRLDLPPTEKLLSSAALSLLGVYLAAGAVYVFALPPGSLWLLPVLGFAGLAAGYPALALLFRDGAARQILGAQILITFWCVGWLASVGSYSGGGWAGDWFEHWERTRFFLEHEPLDKKFLGIYPLTARPPLANLITGAFLHLTRTDFAHYQLVTTLLGSLAFLPAAVLARRFFARLRHDQGGRASVEGNDTPVVALLAVLLMLNPLFVQNATFPWTKLPTAFFILAALIFFLRAGDTDAPRSAAPLLAAFLAAGMLAHYSAGPYLVVLVGAWIVRGWPRVKERAWWQSTAVAALAGTLVLATWFAWSLTAYGAKGTFLSNTSVTTGHGTPGGPLAKIGLNIFDTLVPHFMRPLDTALIAQRSPWGWWRDWFFQSYQVNLLFAFGSVAWLAILCALRRAARETDTPQRVFWTVGMVGTIFLGIAVHGERDHWGLAHICLQPLVLFGLAFLAARWADLARGWKLALFAGAVVDFTSGIVLHFGVQSGLVYQWFTPDSAPRGRFTGYNEVAAMNFYAKQQLGLKFLSDLLPARPELVLALLAALLMLAFVRARDAAQRAP